MLQAAYYILFSIVLLFSLYFALLALFAFIKRKSPIKKHDAKTKFAVLIAARNEAEVIVNPHCLKQVCEAEEISQGFAPSM